MTAAPRVPVVVLLLAAVIFCLGTSEFMIAGILEQIAADVDVSIPQAGLLITAFAVGMIVGAPAMTLLTLRLPTRATLLLTASAFALAHVLGALAPGYGVLLASRFVAAVACGGFWAVASVHAVRSTPPEVVGRALAALVGGLTVANLIGVPAGSWLGEQFGWRSAFWVLGGVTVVATVLIGVTVRPAVDDGPQPSTREILGREVQVFRSGRIWLALATTALFQASVFATFSYFSPLLTRVTGLPADAVPVVLLGFGLGALIGVTVGGRFADRSVFGNILTSLTALMASFALLWAGAGVPAVAVPAVLLVGFSGFSIAGALNARIFQIATDSPTLAASVNTSAFNVGNAAGPALGGAVIGLGLGYRAPLLVGLVLAAGAAAVALVARARDASGPVAGGAQAGLTVPSGEQPHGRPDGVGDGALTGRGLGRPRA